MPPSPPSLGLGLGLARTRSLESLDPDAVAWIDAVMAAGGVLFSTESATKKLASDYFAALKTDSAGDLHALLRRDYHPVWQVAAANAICAKSLTSGTFVGTVTHGVGFVQGDGSTGYFNTGVSPNGLSITANGGMMGVIVNQAPTISGRRFMSAQTGGTPFDIQDLGGLLAGISHTGATASTITLATSAMFGIITHIRENSTSQQISILKTTGATNGAINTSVASGTITQTIVVLARNNGGTIQAHSDYRAGGYFAAGDNFKYANRSAFTLIRKQFYEALTNLNIP
jgi:hypothetical protein